MIDRRTSIFVDITTSMTKLLSSAVLIVFMSCFVFVSCKKASKDSQENEIVELGNDIYGTKSSVIPVISEKAKIYGVQWLGFEDFEIEFRSLNGSTLEQLRTKSERLVQYSDSLTKKIPDTLNSISISSRLVVVRTRANLLFQEVHKSRLDSLRLENAIDEMNVAVTHLILQLNEKFEKDEIDLQRKEADDNDQ